MSLNFPLNPTSGDTYTDSNQQLWEYVDTRWVRVITGTGISDAPTDGTQYGRQDAAWRRLAPDTWYLGPYSVAPTQDNYGNPLQEGHVYFNTVTSSQQAWTGVKWAPFSSVFAASGIKKYVWTSEAEILPNIPLTGSDDYGNTPGGWDREGIVISVFLEGIKLIEQVDPSILLGGYTVNKFNSQIAPANASFPAGAEILIRVTETTIDEPSVRPYVNYMTSASGDLSPIIGPEDEETFYIYGGNFDPTTTVIADSLANTVIKDIVVDSDTRLHFTIIGGSTEGTFSVTVFNDIREQFGNELTFSIKGKGFIATWVIPSTHRNLTLPLVAGYLNEFYLYDFVVDWGDGETSAVKAYDAEEAKHTYASAGTYTTTIVGLCEGWSFDNGNEGEVGRDKLTDVHNLGNVGWKSLRNAFSYCSALKSFTAGSTDTSGVTSLVSFMTISAEYIASALTTVDLVGMDTENVTNMNYAFNGQSAINTLDISSWDLSSCTSLDYTFTDMSSVVDINLPALSATSMIQAFDGASALKILDLSKINPNGTLLNAFGLFKECKSFSTFDLSTFNNSSVTDLDYAFSDMGASPIDLTLLDVSSLFTAKNLVYLTPFTVQQYDALLDAWSNQTMLFEGSLYVEQYYTAESSHIVIDEVFAWHVIDKGLLDANALEFVIDVGISNTFALPLFDNPQYSYNFTVDWGDGTSNTIGDAGDPARTHTYVNTTGSRTVKITGLCQFLAFETYGNSTLVNPVKRVTIGNVGLTYFNMKNARYLEDVFFIKDCFPTAVSLANLFYGCVQLKTITSLDTSFANVTDITEAFFGTGTSSPIPFDDLVISSNCTAMAGAFSSSNITIANLNQWDVSSVTDLTNTFKSYPYSMETMDVSTWDVSNVTSMEGLFAYCNGPIYLASWITSSLTSMKEIFNSLVTSEDIEISGWDTSQVTDFNGAFKYITGTGQVNVDNLDTSAATVLQGMFIDYQLPAGTTHMDLSHFDTTNVTDMVSMLEGVSARTIDVSSFNTSNVTTINLMFGNCDYLQQVNLSTFDFTNIINASGCFLNNPQLAQVIFGTPNTINLVSIASMFKNCPILSTSDISNFAIDSLLYAEGLFKDSPLVSSTMYAATLNNWVNLATIANMGILLDFGSAIYVDPLDAKTTLTTSPNNWIIYDGETPSL